MSEPADNPPIALRENELGELEGAEIYVITPPRRRTWLHALLFLLTIFTTLLVGARLQANFNAHLPLFGNTEDFFPVVWALREPRRLLLGIPFSFTLLLILTAHEMGHYIACLRYRVFATLPFFIPAPTLIGTMGAFIRIQSPIPDRKSLFDIGIGGPIAGFVVAVPAMIIGLLASQHAPGLANDSQIQLGFPLIFHIAHAALPHQVGGLAELNLHPVALAAWVGMFATSLNLLPGGQLDGGHILFAVFPALHRTVSRMAFWVLLAAGLTFWPGWLLWAFVIRIFGQHPRVGGRGRIGGVRSLLAVGALLMFTLTVMPDPFPGNGIPWHQIASWLAYKLHF